jgi:hypothetical protein
VPTYTQVASDTFDSSIDANWDNGPGDFGPAEWVAGGYIQPATDGTVYSLIRNTGTYSPDQYSLVTIKTHAAGNYSACSTVRGAGGADETCYYGQVKGFSGEDKYAINEVDSAFGFTTLASTGSFDNLADGDTIRTVVIGTEIYLYTNESGGGETLRLQATDGTIASGRPGSTGYASGAKTNLQHTAWEGGDATIVFNGPWESTGSNTPGLRARSTAGGGPIVDVRGMF